MFDLVAAVNNDRILEKNLLRSAVLRSRHCAVHLRRGYPSAAAAYNSALRECRNDLVVFAHQDVYLPAGWEQRLQEGIAQVQQIDSRWAVLGVVGVAPEGRHVGHVWSSGLQSEVGAPMARPVAVQSVDELLIVLRRSSGLQFDPGLQGYHLYGTDIVQSALAVGRGAYVIHAPVIHNSLPCLYLAADYFRAYTYVSRKWRSRLPLHSCAALVHAPGWHALRFRMRHKFCELRYSRLDRQSLDRQHDCAALAKRLRFE
jgi:hypothetical protein